MTEAPLRKRDREPEALPDSIDVREPKRFQGGETDRFLHLLQLDQTLADDDDEDEEEEFSPSEELVKGVMRSLEEEIAATCSASYSSSNSGDNVVSSEFSRCHEGETVASDSTFDLCYLLKASDDELGIPPSLVLDMEDAVCLTHTETSEGLLEGPDLKSLCENWNFEDDFENCQKFVAYQDPWDASQLQDYMNRDFASQSILFDGDFSAAWTLETAGGM